MSTRGRERAEVGLREAFVARIPEDSAALLEQAGLDEMLAERVADAQAQWPGVSVHPEAFVAYVADRVAPGIDLEGLAGLAWNDLYLACACATGSEPAIIACERAYFGNLDAALASLDKSGALTDEVKQQVRERLFVAAPGELPKIADFTGRGGLGRWLRVVATRTALNARRRTRREAPLPQSPLPDLGGDVELEHLKSKYQDEFKQAFAEAFETLEPKQKTLLKLHVIDNLTIDQLGSLHNVHRTSAARWLREARQTLAKRTKNVLTQKLKVKPEELESIMRLIRSRIDLSVRVLAGGGEPE
ncbi:MAG: sigma-70 family RNA polymerase sigma factor [Deltaproteobacteria bacterium]|nr:sigma-70 family RNA polymerase sigma factor [Deltaproteobacteria bacterium]